MVLWILKLMYKLIYSIFVPGTIGYLVYQLCSEDTKLWYKISAIVLGAVAIVSYIAQLYISISFIHLGSLALAGLLLVIIAEYYY